MKKIMASVIPKIVGQLSSDNEEHREVASAALGDLVGKLGENVMAQVLPVLIASLTSPESDVSARQGVCLGLAEVIACGSHRQLEVRCSFLLFAPFSFVCSLLFFCSSILLFTISSCLLSQAHLDVVRFAVRQAMCDDNEAVRAAASGAFAALCQSFGQQAVRDLVPSLLDALEEASAADEGGASATLAPEAATHGLRTVIELRGRIVMPMIVSRLVEPPLTAARAGAIATVANAASTIIHSYLGKLLPPLLKTISEGGSDSDGVVVDIAREAATAIVMSVRGDDGVRVLMSRLGELCDNTEGDNLRAEGAWLIGKLCEGTASNLEEFAPSILTHLLTMCVPG